MTVKRSRIAIITSHNHRNHPIFNNFARIERNIFATVGRRRVVLGAKVQARSNRILENNFLLFSKLLLIEKKLCTYFDEIYDLNEN